MTGKKANPLRLASWNIRAGLGTDLRRDPERVLHAIAEMRADIVALQEADHRLGDRPSALPRNLIERHTGLVAWPVAENARSLGWHGIALLARPALLIEQVRRFTLPGLEPRGSVVVDVSAAAGPLRIVGVHLGLLRNSRRRQLDHIRDELAELPERPTIIMGDFNEWSTRRGLGRLVRGYEVLTPPHSFPSRRPLVPLDRIAHSPGLDIRLLDVPRSAPPHPSDHLPVMAELRLETP